MSVSQIVDLTEQRDKFRRQAERLVAEREGVLLALAEWCLPGQSPTEAIRQLREFLEHSERIRREQARRLREVEAAAERGKIGTAFHVPVGAVCSCAVYGDHTLHPCPVHDLNDARRQSSHANRASDAGIPMVPGGAAEGGGAGVPG